MNIQELRIGNFVQIDNELRPSDNKKIFRIVGIEMCSFSGDRVRVEDIHDNTNNFGQLIQYVKPIKIDGSWLKDFGYSLYEEYLCWDDNTDYSLAETNFNDKGEMIYNYIHCDLDRRIQYNPIKYIHELQNFYYAVNKREIPF